MTEPLIEPDYGRVQTQAY